MEASIENMLGLAPLPLPPPSPRIVVSPNHIVLPKAMAAMSRKKRVDALPIISVPVTGAGETFRGGGAVSPRTDRSA